MKTAGLIPELWRTVRHLQPSQLLWRARYAAERRHPLARGMLGKRWTWPSSSPPPLWHDLPSVPRSPISALSGPPAIQELADGIFDLQNKRVNIGRDRPDWRLGTCSQDRLWTVTLHCHEWVDALARAAHGDTSEAEEAASLLRHYVSDWILRCGIDQPGAAELAWNAYAIATRLGWWIRAYSRGPKWLVFESGSDLETSFLRSLWEQAAYLNDHIEWDLRGNHLIRDALGLAWAGRFFSGAQPGQWLRKATDLAVEQVEEQVLPDGGHFERSPKYHCDIMEDLLGLAFLLEDPDAVATIRRAWARMAEYLAWMRHPDGDIPLFNDAALLGPGVASTLLDLGEQIGVSVDTSGRRGGKFFADTGMAVWHGTPWSLFFDVGPVGPDVQPGHAHADTLSIECSFEGQRLFVDPGTFSYDSNGRRHYDRSTEAHNTVEIDGNDSSEMWRIFRVGRRARPIDVSVEFRADGMSAAGTHDGYDHLPGRPRHRRQVVVGENTSLILIDQIAGVGEHDVRGGLLVEPSWDVEQTDNDWRLSHGGLRVRVRLDGIHGPAGASQMCPYHPRYGVEWEATRIGWRLEGCLPREIRTIVESE